MRKKITMILMGMFLTSLSFGFTCVSVSLKIYNEEKFYVFDLGDGKTLYASEKPNVKFPPEYDGDQAVLKFKIYTNNQDFGPAIYVVKTSDGKIREYRECGLDWLSFPIDDMVVGTPT